MSINVFILLIVVGIILAVFIVFYFQNIKLKMNHGIATTLLDSHISTHQDQVRFRQEQLGTYDFLKYNLSQALVVQKDINCNFN